MRWLKLNILSFNVEIEIRIFLFHSNLQNESDNKVRINKCTFKWFALNQVK